MKIIKIVLNHFIRYFKNMKYELLSLLNNKNGINDRIKRDIKIIVSVTSIPSRFQVLHLCLETIMRQTMKPDKIILYLGNNTKNMDLPRKIKKLQARGLDIEYREDKELKPHTKYFYAMQENPNDIVITMDDDILYNKNIIKNLYKSYLKYPNAVSATRVHKITFKDNKIDKYNNWEMEYKEKDALIPNHYLCATGVGGVLYPPNIMPQGTFDKENIKKLALNADDLWLKVMQIKGNIKVVKATKRNYYLFLTLESQTVALSKTNVEQSENDEMMKDLIEYYEIEYSDFK